MPEALLGVLDAPGARRSAYSATLEGKFLVLTNVSIGTVTKVRAPSLSLADRTLLMDVTVDLNASLQIIRWHTPNLVELVNHDVAVIQNGPATHTHTARAEGLADGTYRLTMALTRRWFDTTEPVAPGTSYLDDATIEFDLAG